MLREIQVGDGGASLGAFPPFILASGSPRRREMLRQLGLDFESVPAPADVEEPWAGGEAPDAYARRMAEAKAAAVAADRPEALILAADTIVVLDGAVLGKPTDADHARSMLARLSGRDHTVHTGVALRSPEGGTASGVETTTVTFRPLEPSEIDAYVATGEPLDKAGAYGIQAYGATLVERVSGCYYNVLGFPVGRILGLFRALGLRYLPPGRLA